MSPHERRILHVDMDAFYASIEQRDDPALRGKPVVVGGLNRGVVAAASYEARRYGIRSAMPMREALARCPSLVRVPVRIAHYQSVSRQVFAIFHEFTPLVEGLSLDEAFLDVTGSIGLFGPAEAIAANIKARIREATGLTASVGVAPNKLVAKIASDLGKPDGLVVVEATNLHAVLDPLPVEALPGIGRETLARLHARGIRTVAGLRRAPDAELEPVFGRYTQRVRERAAGRDDRPVVPSRAAKSISAEETFATDLDDPAALHAELLRLTERATARMRAHALAAGTVQVKIRRADFMTCTRQRPLQPPANGTGRVFAVARDLLDAWLAASPGARVRLLGVGGTDLVPAAQADLFADAACDSSVDRTVDAIRNRFGHLALARARTLPRRP
ncbi:MAG TPA: DNA polymerase IV [Woeseiaceae bacterium]|nr:DNA polymerase IV [Woeseiaceae bacterium]